MLKFKQLTFKHLLTVVLLTLATKLIVATAFGLTFGKLKDFKDFAIKFSLLIWVVLLVYIMYKFLKRHTTINTGDKLFMALTVPFVIAWIPEMVFMKTNIFHRYVGIDYVYNCTSDNPELQHRITNAKVYPLNSKAFENANREADENGDCFTQERNFLFWQTAFAQGYDPKSVRSFNQYDSVADYLELSFSVGPLFCLENIFRGLIFNFPMVLIYFLFYDFNQQRIKKQAA